MGDGALSGAVTTATAREQAMSNVRQFDSFLKGTAAKELRLERLENFCHPWRESCFF
jgi:hypothetical protein